MKKFLSLIAVVAVVFSLAVGVTSCSKSPDKVADENIENALKEISLPRTLRDSSVVTDVTYVDKELAFRIEIDKDKFSKVEADTLRKVTLEKLHSGLFPRKLVNYMIQAGASAKYIYVCENDSVMFTFSNEVIKNF